MYIVNYEVNFGFVLKDARIIHIVFVISNNSSNKTKKNGQTMKYELPIKSIEQMIFHAN